MSGEQKYPTLAELHQCASNNQSCLETISRARAHVQELRDVLTMDDLRELLEGAYRMATVSFEQNLALIAAMMQLAPFHPDRN